MIAYTVHTRPSDRSSVERKGDVVLVAEKASFWAFAFGPVWLAANRLWLPLVGWVAIAALAALAGRMLGLDPAAQMALYLMLALLLAWEAPTLKRFGLSRRGYHFIDIVTGQSSDEAAHTHFRRWGSEPSLSEATGRLSVRGLTAGGDSGAGMSPIGGNS